MKLTLARTWALAAMCALVTSSSAARAQDGDEAKGGTLKVGDPAPKLVVDKWVKGEPIKELEKGKVYVLECWATWCGPCVRAIPHVTELQKKYAEKGLVVIGMNVWENDDAAVEPFVEKMGAKMDYRVATDDKKDGGRGKMAELWMEAAGRNGIPCSFIVDRDLKVAWIGHPMQMDEPLEQIISGKFDLAAAAAKAAKEAEMEGKAKDVQRRISNAMRAQEWDKALAAVDEAIAMDAATAPMYQPAKLMILIEKGDFKAANAAAKELSEGETGKDQQMLVNVANTMLRKEDAKGIDLDLAMSIAEKAAGMDGQLAWAGKLMMGKAHAAKGDYAKAIELHTAAMEAAPPQAKQQFQKDLEKYQEKAKESGKSGDAKASNDDAKSDDAKPEGEKKE